MIESMQVTSAVATRSVGEKLSPSPWLSFGASVLSDVPDGSCTAVQRSPPTYSTLIATMALSPAVAAAHRLPSGEWRKAAEDSRGRGEAGSGEGAVIAAAPGRSEAPGA